MDLPTCMYTGVGVHTSMIHNNQKEEATQISIDRCMDKQNEVYAYREISFSLQQEGNSALCYRIDEL